MKGPRINWGARLGDLGEVIGAVLVLAAILFVPSVITLAVGYHNRWAIAACVVNVSTVIGWMAWSWLTQDDFGDRP